jgi:hypothetical protein
MTVSAADRLAALAAGRPSDARAERPVYVRITRDDLNVDVELPGSRRLARAFAREALAADLDLYKAHRGTSLLARPRGSEEEPTPADMVALRGRLVAVLAALPAREDAGEPYNAVRDLARLGEAADVEDYVSAVLHQVRLLSPAWRGRPQPKAPHPIADPKARVRARVTAHRERARAQAEETAEWWLRLHLAEAPAGEQITSSDLWDQAREEVAALVAYAGSEDWAEEAADAGYPLRPRLPGRDHFYRLAARVFDDAGGRRVVRPRKSDLYVYPPAETAQEAPVTDPARDALAQDVLDRVARMAWEEVREYLLATLASHHAAQASTAAATGTDGRVLDLAARRRTH